MVGFDSRHERRTLFYGHSYSGMVRPVRHPRRRDRVADKVNLLKELLFPKESLIPYDE